MGEEKITSHFSDSSQTLRCKFNDRLKKVNVDFSTTFFPLIS